VLWVQNFESISQDQVVVDGDQESGMLRGAVVIARRYMFKDRPSREPCEVSTP